MKALFNYLSDSVNELKLVTWPKQEETIRMTVITVIFVLAAALILGLLDFGFAQAYQWILSFGA